MKLEYIMYAQALMTLLVGVSCTFGYCFLQEVRDCLAKLKALEVRLRVEMAALKLIVGVEKLNAIKNNTTTSKH